ncbi:MAG: T9SS type A sorting domain-containing protein [Candidatus Zixiibacteriota bacterium]
MKNGWLILLILLVCITGETAWSTCPQDANDRGNCDTMYIEPWDEDAAGTGVHFVRVPIYITADIAGGPYDSIQAFVIPLCFTRNNPTKYCSVSTYWNRILWTTSNLPRSIFHHLPSNDDPQVHNWMMDLYENSENNGEEWDGVILDLTNAVNADTGHFWLSLIPSGQTDQRFIEGSRILLATMTMKLEDTMHVCIDTCFWPPHSRLAFAVAPEEGTIGITKIPRSSAGDSASFKVCFPPRDTSDVKEIEGDNIKPSGFSLSQNYPNPFNPVTNIQFTVPKSSHVKIEIFNIVGQKVAILVDGDMKPGLYTADWNGRDESGKTVSSGIYFYRMRADDFSDMKKMVLVK